MERLFVALILLFPRLLASSFASQRGFYTLLLAGLQVKGVALDLLDDVFLLHFSFKPAQSVLEGFSLLKSYFCQNLHTPRLVRMDRIVITRILFQVKSRAPNFFTKCPEWEAHFETLQKRSSIRSAKKNVKSVAGQSCRNNRLSEKRKCQ